MGVEIQGVALEVVAEYLREQNSPKEVPVRLVRRVIHPRINEELQSNHVIRRGESRIVATVAEEAMNQCGYEIFHPPWGSSPYYSRKDQD